MSAGWQVEVEGIGGLRDAFGMQLLDGWQLPPPQPVLRLVDVPGRSGSLDLTDALGGPFFGDRRQTLRFAVTDCDPEGAKALILRALHGRRVTYRLPMDPDHTYRGRWSVEEAIGHHSSGGLVLTVSVVADPYRYGDDRIVTVDAARGRRVVLPCGDLPSTLTVECDAPTRIGIGGEEYRAPQGRSVLADLLLLPGDNELWVVSGEPRDTRWDYVGPGGGHPLTWDGSSGLRWDELARVAGDDGMATRSWGEAGSMSWAGIARLDWRGVLYRTADAGDPPYDSSVTFEYEWRDL